MNAPAKYFRPEVLSKISRLELRARHVVEGFVSGMHKSPYKGLSIEFDSHRPYVPGDDIRHIDWRVYAKADRFFIKQYEGETNMRAHLLLDCSASMGYPAYPHTERMTKWEYAATVAASLAYLLLRQQDAVSLALFDNAVRRQTPVSTSPASLQDLVAVVESTSPAQNTDVRVPFKHLVGHVPRRGMVVVLSDLLTDVDDITRGLQHLRYHGHDVLVMHVLHQDELEFPFANRTLFEGLEDPAREVLTDPQSLRGSYLASLHGFIKGIQAACLDQRVDYALMNTADPLDVALSTFLATRMHRQRAK